jgi:hypothetical protein
MRIEPSPLSRLDTDATSIGDPSNKRMQQTVRPVTSVAGQRPRQAVPQLTLECSAARKASLTCNYIVVILKP